MKRKLLWSALLILAPCLCQGQSGITTLNFEGLKDTEPVLNYYNGGFGGGVSNSSGVHIPGSESGPGPNDGITFSDGSLALTSMAAGGQGNFINEPSPSNVLFFSAGFGDVMNVAGGFRDGFSFFYTGEIAGAVTVWSGQDGTGTQLASLSLSAIAAHNGINDTWVPIGVGFNGTAGSVNFSGTADNIAFDNITLGSAIPTGSVGSNTPAPSSLTVLAVAALFGAGAYRRQRRISSCRTH